MLEQLSPFVGEWDLEPSFPTLPGATGRTVFEWALGRALPRPAHRDLGPGGAEQHLRSSAPTRAAARSRSTTSTRAASSASTP